MNDEAEIFIPWPEVLDLDAIADEINGQWSNDVENHILQGLCTEGSAAFDFVEVREGRLLCHWKEDVYMGCRDITFANNCDVVLAHEILDGEIRIYVAQDTVTSVRDWRGE